MRLHTFKQKDVENYLEDGKKVQGTSLKMPQLRRSYTVPDLYILFKLIAWIPIDASVGGSMIKMQTNDAYDLYEKIVEISYIAIR